MSYNVVSRGGTMVGFVMEKLSPLPDHFAEWSAVQRRGAVAALETLAGLGVIHDDTPRANVGQRGSEVRWWYGVFDFESVSVFTKPGRLCVVCLLPRAFISVVTRLAETLCPSWEEASHSRLPLSHLTSPEPAEPVHLGMALCWFNNLLIFDCQP